MANERIMNKFKYLLSEYAATKDPEFAMQIADMFITKQMSARTAHDGEWKFFPVSKFKCKCQGCGECYEPGEKGVFVLDGKGWHNQCAPQAAKDATQKFIVAYEAKQAKEYSVIQDREKEEIFTDADESSDDPFSLKRKAS